MENRVYMIKLHDELAVLVNEGKITVSHAYIICRLPPEKQIEFKSQLLAMAVKFKEVQAESALLEECVRTLVDDSHRLGKVE